MSLKLANQQITEFSIRVGHLEEANRRLENQVCNLSAENQRLRVDAERLDWLNDNWCYPVDSQNEFECGDWRVAIDEAQLVDRT